MNSIVAFSTAIAQDLLLTGDEFPVSFDSAWQWLGFSTKGHAKTSLLASGLIEDVDFIVAREPTTTGIQAHPNENITLTYKSS